MDNPFPTEAKEWRRLKPQLLVEAERLYQEHVQPFEQEHWGEYAVVPRDGHIVVHPVEAEAAKRALASFGPGSFLFKIGDIALGKVR